METILEVVNLKKSYGRLRVIDGISFRLKKGERLGIFGPSGCGKTTLLKIIAGIIENFEGKVHRNFESSGFVFQEDRLIPWLDVFSNLKFVCDDDMAIENVLRMVRLADFKRSYPHELSGGMRQRVNLGRALVINPQLLLLDEPFSSLDIHIKMRLIRDINKICRDLKVSVINVTHDPREAALLSDRVLVFSPRPAKIIKELVVRNVVEAEKEILDIAEKNF